MRLTITYALLLGSLIGLPRPAAAADSAIERATLTGLTTMSVVVEGLSPIAEKNGLTTAALQSEVTRRLRQAGISIIEDADAYVYVHVTVADAGASLPLPYLVDVSLMQEVTLPRGLKTRTPLQCPTWSLNRLGLAGQTLVRSAVTDRVTEFVDQFIAAYRSVNPK
ncbi:MAG: hypothetical protein LAO77_04145 [Acidobacteriia bacterium]|nr:hypothetical protein [Terriglobia bacterium]